MRLEMKCETNIGGKPRQRNPRIARFIFVLQLISSHLLIPPRCYTFAACHLEESVCPGHPVLLWSEAPTRT